MRLLPFVALLALRSLAYAQSSPPVEMRILLLGGDGTDLSYQAMRSFLDHVGVPYDAVPMFDRGSNTIRPLPPLTTSSQGLYQGIILSTDNLAFERSPGAWDSALTPAAQTALENYMRSHKVRLLSYYTFPTPALGMQFSQVLSTGDTTPGLMTVTSAGVSVFPYLTRQDPIKVFRSYSYLATPVQASGETTRSVLTMNGGTVGVLHTKADGREYLALTVDNNVNFQHSMLLHYGLVNWVAKGIFLGHRKIYLTPQNDDLFLSSELFVATDPYCQPNCPERRIAGADLNRVANWQDSWTSRAQTQRFKVTIAYNGFGATTAGGAATNDSLVNSARNHANKFFWVSHTYDHENLDCYQRWLNGGNCRPATYDDALFEITQNVAVANTLRLNLDRASMVTPEISGLYNAEFLRAAAAQGLRYMVSDTSRGDLLPARPNEGVYSTIQPNILFIPRRPTHIYYNTSSGLTGVAGSLPDEFNWFYGPNGIFRLPGGEPFFSSNQTYAQIIERESEALLTYMLRYEMYPSMYHQANFWRYESSKTLFTDVLDATLRKFTRLSNLPVISLAQSEIGRLMAERMTYNGAGVRAILTPGVNITFTATRTARVPVTGICKAGCETYGSQRLSTISVAAGQATVVALP